MERKEAGKRKRGDAKAGGRGPECESTFSEEAGCLGPEHRTGQVREGEQLGTKGM